MPTVSITCREQCRFQDRKRGREAGNDLAGGGSSSCKPPWREPYYGSRRDSPRGTDLDRYRQGCSPSQSGSGRNSISKECWDSGESPRPVISLRSVAIPVSPVSSLSSQPPLKDHHDKSGGAVNYGCVTGPSYDRDRLLGSIGWKRRKWTRPGSSEAAKAESGSEVETAILSPATSPLMDDEDIPRKKPRLAWGQGLAKREKKVEGSSDTAEQSRLVQCATSATSNSSLAGFEEKSCIKEAGNSGCHSSDASFHRLQGCSEELFIKLGTLDASAISNLTSLLADLLQPEDACSGDSSFTCHTAMNKLLELKGDITKELEKTECEIDLLENELKKLNADGETDPCQSSLSFEAACPADPCLGPADVTLKMPLDCTRPKDNLSDPLVALEGEFPLHTDSLEEQGAEVKDLNDDNLVSGLPKSGFDSQKLIESPLDGEESRTTDSGHVNGNCLDATRVTIYADPYIMPNSKIDNLIASIIALNKEAARKASEVFHKALSTDPPQHEIWRSDCILACRRNDAHVSEKLVMHKGLFKFKERVLGLKYRALQQLWKEDLQLLSIRKNRPKSQKHMESSSRSTQSTQRHRSSTRSRFTLPGNFSLVPTTQVVDFISKLLSHSQINLHRKSMNMPALILDETERKYSRFISYNGLVEDPATFEKDKAMINPWTDKEMGVFKEMLATFGKDFTKISSFLPHKTTADCIEFYYKNHKSESFKEVKRQLDLRKQSQCLPPNTYMVAPGKKWNREASALSLDMSKVATVVAAECIGNSRNQLMHSGSFSDLKVTQVATHERETETAVSSEAVSSCVTRERPQSFDEEDTSSDEGCGEVDSVDWTDKEKSLLIKALSVYGKDFPSIARFVGTRSRQQCKIFFSKARKCLGLDSMCPGPGTRDTLISHMNGGQSEMDDACAPDMDSVICSTQSSEQCEVRPNCEEADHKVDRPASVLDIEKLAKEWGNPQSAPVDAVEDTEGSFSLDELKTEVDLQQSKEGDNVPNSEIKVAAVGRVDFGPMSKPEAQLQPCPRGSGDIKIFGQILSQPLSLKQKESLIVKPSAMAGSGDRLGQTELPLRSYGFWDGNRIQMGYSLTESAVMLAKCQGSLPSSNGVLTDYQQGWWLDGFETVPGVHEQGRAKLGALMGAREGVSDPVAALKRHYARRAKVLTSKVEPWRGDVGGG